MSSRGRRFFSNTPRSTRSPSRGGFRGRGSLGFFNRGTRLEEAKKLEEVKKDVENLQEVIENKKIEKSLVSQQKNESLNKSKIDATVEKGKEFVSKFFKGFTQPERGNIKVTMSSFIPAKVVAPYTDRIRTYAEYQFQHDPEKFNSFSSKFRGMVEIGLAIKLHRSSTDFEKNLNFRFSSIRNLDIPLPKKMNILLNQLGKTDLMNDNRIRIKNQHLNVKRYLLRGAAFYMGQELDQYLNGSIVHDTVLEMLTEEKKMNRSMDISIASLDLLKDIGRKYFEKETNRNFKFKFTSGKAYEFRLPVYDFGDPSVESITEYFNNNIFSDFNFDKDTVYKIIASLVFQVAKFHWLKERDKTLAELEPKFKHTIIADYTFREVMTHCSIYLLEEFIDDNVLDDVINLIISRWKSADMVHFGQMFNMEEVKFSEFGSDSQLIEIGEYINKKDHLGYEYQSIKNRSPVESVLKTSEYGAIMGLMVGYSKKIEFSSKFLVNFDSKNDQILNEFIKSDFKM